MTNVFEYYGSASNSEVYEYQVNAGKNLVLREPQKQPKRWRNYKSFLSNVFLPQGYPESVSDDYLPYQIWDTAQAFCSGITGTLATQAVLKGAGVGDSSATAAGATITWLLKDGTGMIGRIAFAYLHGTGLDANAKQWRLFADVLNDCAIFVQLLAPLFPKSYFTLIMCLSSLAFSLVGVAGGCTRAALTMHQAKRNNMADVSAKDGSQETLVNLAALIVSLIITPLVSGHTLTTWTLFIIFSIFHVYANYKAVTAVVMNVMNRNRLFKVLDEFVASTNHHILSPSAANRAEPVFLPSDHSWLKLGCKLKEINLNADEFLEEISKNPNMKYLMKLDNISGKVYVALSHDASSEDIIRASYQAYLIRHLLQLYSTDEDKLINKLKFHGWDLSIQHLCPDEWRWSLDKSFAYGRKEQNKYV